MPRKKNYFTPEKQKLFLDTLKETASTTKASAIAGVGRRTVYTFREQHKSFAESFQEALDIGLDKLEDEARRRAYEGYDEPIFYKGQQVSLVKKYDPILLMFLLKAHRPEKYRESHEIKFPEGINVTVKKFCASDKDKGTNEPDNPK